MQKSSVTVQKTLPRSIFFTAFESLFIRLLQKKKRETSPLFFFWRRQRDSNPRAFRANGFQDRLVMTTSICLRILMYEIVLSFINSKRRPPRYVLLRYPKFLRSANASLKISTAATPYASLTHPPGALGDVPTSICLRI